MGLNSFTKKNQERALPIFVLADTSGSMDGEKIVMLNNALREMVAVLSGMEDIRGVFKICIITFGREVKVHQKLLDVHKIQLTELTVGGRTPLGEAIERAISMIEDKTVVPSTAYTPTVVLVSDGWPTDIREEDATYEGYLKWEPIVHLHNQSMRASKCLCLAMGIGEDADTDMLKAFIQNEKIPVFKSNEASGILPFFKWVTMSTVSRMKSGNPDDINVIYPADIDEDDQPII